MILLKYPSRNRPTKFMTNLDLYIKLSVSNLLIVISMDKDDVSMNNQDIRTYLESKQDDRIRLKYFYGESLGKINAINRDIPMNENWTIIVVTADDMIPLETGWDRLIEKDMGNDLYKSINYNTDPRVNPYTDLITLPIIGRKLYERMGYIYHPDYISEYCDNEQTSIFNSMGVLYNIDKRPIIHKWDENQDELMRRNIQIGYRDKSTFEKRKKEGFFK